MSSVIITDILRDYPIASVVFLSLTIIGGFIFLWDSRAWFRRQVSALLPTVACFMLFRDERRQRECEKLVAKALRDLAWTSLPSQEFRDWAEHGLANARESTRRKVPRGKDRRLTASTS